MKGQLALRNWRVWILLLTIWAVIVVVGFVLFGSDYGCGALIGGPAGLLGAFVAIHFHRRRGSANGKPD